MVKPKKFKLRDYKITIDYKDGKGKLELQIYEEWIKPKSKEKGLHLKEDWIVELDYGIEKGKLMIDSIDVVDEYQRKGLGRLTMNIMKDIVRYLGLKEIELTSSSDATGFYRKLGFKRVGNTNVMIWRNNK